MSLTNEWVDTFGPMVSRGDVTASVLTQLQSPRNGLIWYLAERERRRGLAPRTLLAPPSPASYRPGLDFETFGSDELPVVIVVVQRDGEPERFDQGRYDQRFECQAGAIVEHQTEAEATDLADEYGIALAAAIGQQPSMGGLVTSARMTGYPFTEFVNPDRRNLVRCTVTYLLAVDPVLDESGDVPLYSAGPYARPEPVPPATEVDLTLVTESLDGTQTEETDVVLDTTDPDSQPSP